MSVVRSRSPPNLTSASLCLACSSSLSPHLLRRLADPATAASALNEIHLTSCCGRPICSLCLKRNHRLAMYDPCLACLGGVSAVGPKDRAAERVGNADGAVKDADLFVVGDEDDEEGGDERLGSSSGEDGQRTPPPAYDADAEVVPTEPSISTVEVEAHSRGDGTSLETDESSRIYYIQPNDTLLGLSLRLGVNARTLCRLNALPPSTLRTTPHLLHTRGFLILPPFNKDSSQESSPSLDASLPPPPPPKSPTRDTEELAHRARVRAQLRLQTVTHETDWRVAQAYVALAESEDAEPDALTDDKKAASAGDAGMSERAVDKYLDDDEWEAQELREGRGVTIERFPFGAGSSRGAAEGNSTGWAGPCWKS